MDEYYLNYKKSAAHWEDSLPLGNGRLGACVFGRIDAEIIRLNEKTLWEGYTADWTNPDTKAHLDEMRRLFLSKNYVEAASVTTRYFKCDGNGESEKYNGGRYGTFRNAGDIVLVDKNNNVLISRSLDMLHGVAETDTQGYTATHIIALTENAGVTQIKAKGGKLNFDIRFDKDGGGYNNDSEATKIKVNEFDGFIVTKDISEPFENVSVSGDTITYSHRFSGNGALLFAFTLKAVTDGKTSPLADGLTVENADTITLYYSVHTEFDTEEPASENEIAIQAAIANKDIFRENAEKFASFMKRSVLTLESDEKLKALPTDERLERIKQGNEDTGFAELYFNYGKYLLIASSAPGSTLPANLQGIWSRDNTPPWSADYHTNINLQMNYWHANVLNLSDCEIPMLDYILLMQKYGAETAEKMFGCSGWVAFHTTTPWGYTAPGRNPVWGSFACGGAWCCLHIFEHYRYTLDKAVLKKYWNAAKESARFFLDYLIEDENGYLVICPTNSPENSFINPIDGSAVGMSAGDAMDSEILRDLFEGILELKNVADENDTAFLEKIEYALKKLPPIKVGKNGTVMEWLEDYNEAWPGHRHISHLFALYPSNQINTSTPELMEAARKTIERRLSNGGGHTGWSQAWIINFFARLYNGEEAYKHLNELFRVGTLSNLFDKHPPFQIDGNFGGCAAIANMLITPYGELLPALPKAWKNGSFSGFCIHGNKTVSCAWENGKIIKREITVNAK